MYSGFASVVSNTAVRLEYSECAGVAFRDHANGRVMTPFWMPNHGHLLCASVIRVPLQGWTYPWDQFLDHSRGVQIEICVPKSVLAVNLFHGLLLPQFSPQPCGFPVSRKESRGTLCLFLIKGIAFAIARNKQVRIGDIIWGLRRWRSAPEWFLSGLPVSPVVRAGRRQRFG